MSYEWTDEEVYQHLRKTFDGACSAFPDVMEPYAIQSADLTDVKELKSLMRRALRETFKRRYAVTHTTEEAAET